MRNSSGRWEGEELGFRLEPARLWRQSGGCASQPFSGILILTQVLTFWKYQHVESDSLDQGGKSVCGGNPNPLVVDRIHRAPRAGSGGLPVSVSHR